MRESLKIKRPVFGALAALLLAACSAGRYESEAVSAACEPDERGPRAMAELRTRALQGEAGAARCWIALTDTDPSLASLGETDRIAMRYVLWIIEGERPEDILDMAARQSRVDLIGPLELAHFRLEISVNTGVSPDGCTLRPPEMEALWRAARPGGGSEACDHFVMAPNSAYEALSDAERRHMGLCRRQWWEIGSDYDGSRRAAGEWLPEDCLQYTRDGGWIGTGHPIYAPQE